MAVKANIYCFLSPACMPFCLHYYKYDTFLCKRSRYSNRAVIHSLVIPLATAIKAILYYSNSILVHYTNDRLIVLETFIAVTAGGQFMGFCFKMMKFQLLIIIIASCSHYLIVVKVTENKESYYFGLICARLKYK